MFWRTDSGSRPTSYPATWARPDVGFSRPQSMRMVVDLPAPFGPRKPNTSPLRIVRLMRSTATKSPNRLSRFSITTELLSASMDSRGMDGRSTADRIAEEVFDSGRNLLNRVEWNVRAVQSGFEFGNTAGGGIHPHLQGGARRVGREGGGGRE